MYFTGECMARNFVPKSVRIPHLAFSIPLLECQEEGEVVEEILTEL